MPWSSCPDRILDPAPPAPPRFGLHHRGDPARDEVESFIRSVYAAHYGADVRGFAPVLVSLRDERDHLLAAAGYRPAADGPLFLERYLENPVQELLDGSATGAAPARDVIVEVGHLAAARAGEGRHLIMLLGPHLATCGFQWVVGTLTEELRHLFIRIGVVPQALGTADPTVLGEHAGDWGTYYDHRPVVLAGHLRQALARLARRQSTRLDA